MKKIYLSFIFLIFCILISLDSQKILAQKTDFNKTAFVVYGDSMHDNDVHQKIVSDILLNNPDFVLYTGDIKNSSGDWETHLKITEPIHSILYPTPGNHEKPFDTYFEVYSKLYNNTNYYSFDKEDVHIISLDSNINFLPDSQQYDWIVNDLDTHKDSKWKIIFFHHPPYSSGCYKLVGGVKTLVPLFEKYDVDIIFNGHYHLYERSFPIYQDKINSEGIIYIITGGGGSSLNSAFNNLLISKSVAMYNFVRVEVSGDDLKISAYDVDNEKIDEYTIKKNNIQVSFREKLLNRFNYYFFTSLRFIKNLRKGEILTQPSCTVVL